MAKLPRSTTSSDVLELVRARILDGHYPPNAKLDEVALARELGVSRTPLREALFGLTRDGLIRHEPFRGRIVTTIENSVVAETFPIIGSLESLAIRSVRPWSADVLDELDRLNDKIARPQTRSRTRHALDHEWHCALVRASGNARLSALHERELARAARYDGGAERGMQNVEDSTREHAELTGALRAGKIAKAAKAAEDHWSAGIERIRAWRQEQ